MKKSVRTSLVAAIALIGAVAGVWTLRPSRRPADDADARAAAVRGGKAAARPPARPAAAAEPAAAPEPAESLSEEERREAEEEKLVAAFDALTDKWMEAADGATVTLEDVRVFSARFREVPDSRRDECLHRALNLIPDDHIMLLAGILMDKSYGSDTLELVFNDVLNRDEDVKKPILKEIFKDRTHPCWADTAWILDVTGELPAQKGE